MCFLHYAIEQTQEIIKKAVDELQQYVAYANVVKHRKRWIPEKKASQNTDISCLKKQLKDKLKVAGIHHPTIEVEKENEYCEFEENCC